MPATFRRTRRGAASARSDLKSSGPKSVAETAVPDVARNFLRVVFLTTHLSRLDPEGSLTELPTSSPAGQAFPLMVNRYDRPRRLGLLQLAPAPGAPRLLSQAVPKCLSETLGLKLGGLAPLQENQTPGQFAPWLEVRIDIGARGAKMRAFSLL
jgi:hypothetical protein